MSPLAREDASNSASPSGGPFRRNVSRSDHENAALRSLFHASAQRFARIRAFSRIVAIMCVYVYIGLKRVNEMIFVLPPPSPPSFSLLSDRKGDETCASKGEGFGTGSALFFFIFGRRCCSSFGANLGSNEAGFQSLKAHICIYSCIWYCNLRAFSSSRC